MILVAGGDSLIYGSELADQQDINPSLSTYPALLASQTGLTYNCTAWPGNSNNAISRMTLAKCQQLKQTKFAVLIQWSFTPRFEFRFNYNTRQRISPWYSINPWTIENDIDKITDSFTTFDLKVANHQIQNIKTAKETGVAEFANTFFKHVGDSEYYELYNSFKEIVFMQNYLKLNNIPYLFTCADNTFYNSAEYLQSKDLYLESLYNQIDWNQWYLFPKEKGFYWWAIDNKYSIGATHPLETAHSDAAKLLKEKFNELVTQHL